MNWQLLDTFLTRVRPHRERLALLLDLVVVALAWQFTYLFRLGFERWFSARPGYDGYVLIGVLVAYAIALLALHVPKGMWRFSGFGEVKRLALVCGGAGLVSATVIQMAHLLGVPRAVLALHPLFTLMLLAMMRMGYRMLYEHMRSRISGSAQEQRRALVMGAGDAGRLLVAGLQHTQGWVIVGFLDDAKEKQAARVAGVPVLGRLEQAEEFAELHGITHLIVAMPGASTQERRRALDIAGKVGLPVLTVPSSEELLAGRAVNQVRDIEPEDLLGREPVVLDEGGISECLNGKVVLITGAGGSIGSELCRQVARYGPSKIVLYELSEFALYTIEQELSEKFPHLPLVRLIGDVKDLEHLRHVFGKYKPQIVFHAAAYKHVPLMEEDDNALACLRNNTLGTYNTCLAAAEHGAERFVLISTDKAVNPTNVMGATKRAAELVVSHMSGQGHVAKFMAVRFGNVLGSSGSVIPKFKEQIAKGGPVTVTHPDITRYFMTIPEAARLVVQACAIGETGQVYVLDMGEPVRIVDLARDMIRLAGHSEHDVRIVFSGLRPGEKLYEEMLVTDEQTLPTKVSSLFIAKLAPQAGRRDSIHWLGTLSSPYTDQSIRVMLSEVLGSEYVLPSRSGQCQCA
ncbi:polysaccharide biosynthesis protein [Roseateles saccharophilus]|uniref:FlaA1/EpsC-like NDP-sugar epimerase n=1 Tax=Roseateles saccharophilus TaxID=304 RepID=A0A4R3U409_ROSSA|nr:nucleoside-diphosphate sugar epimerase/dehydratase [Roseateles saccharophilus]MDG0836239.1 polysaccharide biosynthesis protein [Roseateles saccharophilus]TCU81288.1 FlaA1/EpsC-like NDP-sugar epimerase [Roseateles saccharophilus]